eukprot:TRINITY_DN401_c0_g1_i2.p1 TRINITY_DN401_c0_g1~~TRINITY_DN401_c0_g1_i2.p1  ORF type:complete len:260 (+),score=39.21 TRINITY_DN401_c0_g1_i2:98-877(+)
MVVEFTMKYYLLDLGDIKCFQNFRMSSKTLFKASLIAIPTIYKRNFGFGRENTTLSDQSIVSTFKDVIQDMYRGMDSLGVWAATKGYPKLIEKLRLEDVNMINKLFTIACIENWDQVIEALIQKMQSSDISVPRVVKWCPNPVLGRNSIHSLCFLNHSQCLKKILPHISDEELMTKENIFSQTALHIASQKGHLDVVKLLLSTYQGDKVKYIQEQDKDGYTSISLADTYFRSSVSKYLKDFVLNNNCNNNDEEADLGDD